MPRHPTKCFVFLLLIKKRNKTDIGDEGNTLNVMFLDTSKVSVYNTEDSGIRVKQMLIMWIYVTGKPSSIFPEGSAPNHGI